MRMISRAAPLRKPVRRAADDVIEVEQAQRQADQPGEDGQGEDCQLAHVNVPPDFGKNVPPNFTNDVPPVFTHNVPPQSSGELL